MEHGRFSIEKVRIDLMGKNIILCQSHFIKTVEDVYETLISSSPSIKFGIAFNEASGDRLIRHDGNDTGLIKESIDIARRVGSGHLLVILIENAYPINVLDRVKRVDEVAKIYAASANPVTVLVYDDGDGGRAVLGVIDGKKPLGVEKDEDKRKRYKLLRDIGYKK